MPIRSGMILIMGQIDPDHSELFALELGKIAETDFVYTLASTNINQSAPIITKLGQNVCDHKISEEFDYGFNWTKTVPSYLPLNLQKLLNLTLLIP